MQYTPIHREVTTTDQVPVLRLLAPAPRDLAGVEREPPYILRGRDEEFSHIMNALAAPGATAYVIEGPPGTGKTALTSAVCAYAGCCGYTVMKFDASEIRTPQQVIHALWQKFNPDGKPKGVIRKPFRLDAKILEAIGFGFTVGKEQLFEAIESMLENLQQCAELYHMQNRCTEGFLFVFDNAATWRDIEQLPADDAKRLALKALCNTLHDVVRYMEPRIPTLMLVAGTPGTVDTFEGLTSGRLSINTRYHLTGVDDIAIEEIIADHLRLQMPDGTDMLTSDVICSPNLQTIARICEGNVWHATQVGQRLQEAYLQQPALTMDDAEILRIARYARTEVYTSILRRLYKEQTPAKVHVFTYLAAAAQERDNRLDPMRTEELLQQANQIVGESTTISDYIQWGVLENRMIENCYPHRLLTDSGDNHFRIPIPSFGEHVLTRHPDKGNLRAATVAEYLRTMPHIPAWTWRAADNIKKFVQLPPAPLHGYVPGQAGVLHPAIPGDEPRVRDITPETGWRP